MSGQFDQVSAYVGWKCSGRIFVLRTIDVHLSGTNGKLTSVLATYTQAM